uniref:C1q domain-containing protein n=1 Tax=Sinocyclocheilus anshuiensis TaxID=1608454 RepID=A0A671RM08_9TELE
MKKILVINNRDPIENDPSSPCCHSHESREVRVYIPKVAFSASLLTSFRPQSIGPFRNGLHTLIYRYVFLNTGKAYDPNTVIFTAPVRGAYAFRVFSKAFGSLERAVTAGLFKNGQHIISTHGHQSKWFYQLFKWKHHHSTFSGHLFLM